MALAPWMAAVGWLGTAEAAAQGRFSVLSEASLNRAYTHFWGDALVSHRLDVYHMPSRAFAVGGQYRCSDHLSVKLNAGIVSHGLAFQTYADAPGGQQWRVRGTSKSFEQDMRAGLTVVYYFPSSARQHRWLAEGGLDVLTGFFAGPVVSFKSYAFDNARPAFTFDITGGTRIGPPFMEATVTPTRFSYSRRGVYLAAGHEWQLRRRHHLSTRLVACIGLEERARWRLDYTTWDIAPDVDPVSYHNEVTSKVTWIGAQAAYRFQL
ncbi:hypothetical protein EJV47_05780 [Hymenobacter gummosus]|uniref:Outer membrane protein beta-barrel domain-containing protein n=1 Tax=Hymenobacter gummosus TaxID=1776032 RepID=A0A3S0HQU7_9BACT|nr:hypothetical protein [Hymenobacter gummosus]RTQ52521.1 hypothetical protein EJV47_05780 [Hymenobacter gummosus]